MPETDVNTVSALLTDFNTKINDIEERHNLLKEKVLILGQSFLKEQERNNKEIGLIKEELRETRTNIEKIKEGLQHIINESAGFARKEELKIIERYMKLWEPLKFVKEEEVRSIINEELSKTLRKK